MSVELCVGRKSDFGLWHLICAAALCYPAYGRAQTSPQSDASIEEIVVTAQRRRENLQDVPSPSRHFQRKLWKRRINLCSTYAFLQSVLHNDQKSG
jgi:hypothetical protein